MRRETPEDRCLTIAAAQHGAFSRRQAMALGMSKSAIFRRITSRRWEELFPAVYRLRGAPELWEQRVMALVLWGGEGSVASHRTAAALWRLDGFPPGPAEITSPARRLAPPGIGLAAHHSTLLGPEHVTRARGIPVTRPERTLLDLAAVLELDPLEAAIDSALRRELLTRKSLERCVARSSGKGRRGVGALRKLLDRHRGTLVRTDSPLESRLLRLLVEAGLPPPVVGHEVKEAGRVIARIDLAYPGARLAIEADGYRHHSSRREWARDQVRQNALVQRRWRVLRFTHQDLADPDSVAGAVRQALR